MAAHKKGTGTVFSDRNGATIKVGDRLKSIKEGQIFTVDSPEEVLSSWGVRRNLSDLKPVDRGLTEKGEPFARLTNFEITDDMPPVPDGEKVTAGEVEDLTTGAVKEARRKAQQPSTKPKAPKPKKAATKAKPEVVKAADDGGGETRLRAQIRKTRHDFGLGDFSDDDLVEELRNRGWRGAIEKQISIQI